jgi:hypothetical protein
VKIRKHDKDHLRQLAVPLHEVSSLNIDSTNNDPLRFWTHHSDEPSLLDLNIFATGQADAPVGGDLWLGAFSGRPGLVSEIAPVIFDSFYYASPRTIGQCRHWLRAWWRIFDKVEASADIRSSSSARVGSIVDISEIHRQVAFDSGMRKTDFNAFVRIVNIVRLSLGLRKLHWTSPDDPTPNREIAAPWQFNKLRFALKHSWYAAIDRWERADQLKAGAVCTSVEEQRLKMNYVHFNSAIIRLGKPRPNLNELKGDMPYKLFNDSGYSVPDMLRGSFPDSFDIRVAFHLCLASTGWNPTTLLNLDITSDFISPHPKDSSRYILHGHKRRGDSFPTSDGLYKSQASAGMIIVLLIERTKLLREKLKKEVSGLRLLLVAQSIIGASTDDVDATRRQIVASEKGLKSPWLFVSQATEKIAWLRTSSYSIGNDGYSTATFLDQYINDLNKNKLKKDHISKIRSSDFRDAFAEYAYRFSGGQILFVMKALGHRRATTTQDYINNNVMNADSKKLYRTFSNAFWKEIETHGRVDPTILAKWSQDAEVTHEQRTRLSKYRDLRRSRIGVGCKNPTQPPQHISPNFFPDGQSMCVTHRCTLCIENAVIFPDSISGLCQRFAELQHLRTQMSSVAFAASSFHEEYENTEAALSFFDTLDVDRHMKYWSVKINDGTHFIISYDGV